MRLRLLGYERDFSSASWSDDGSMIASGGSYDSICKVYRGTSLIRTPPLLGPYRRTTLGVLWWSRRGGLFLMSKVPLYPEYSRSNGPRQARPTQQGYLAHKKTPTSLGPP